MSETRVVEECTRTGSVTISRWTSNGEPPAGITIEVLDNPSGEIVVRAELSVEDLGFVLTGLACVPCMYITGDHTVLGKRREWISLPRKDRPDGEGWRLDRTRNTNTGSVVCDWARYIDEEDEA